VILLLSGCLLDVSNPRFDGSEYDPKCGPRKAPVLMDNEGFGDLTSAVAAAGDGSVIELCPGTYNERVHVLGGLTVEGRTTLGEVILDGTGVEGAILFLEGDATVRNLIFENGVGEPTQGGGSSGGAIATADRNRTLVVEDSVFRNNSSTGGGAIYCDGEVTVRGSVFEDNSGGPSGGAIMAFGDVLVEDSEFRGNDGEYGGALYVEDASVEVTDSLFEDNVGQFGGAAMVFGDALFAGVDVQNNSATALGGGLAFVDGDTELRDSTLLGNTAVDGGNELAVMQGATVVGISMNVPVNDTEGVWVQNTTQGRNLAFPGSDFECSSLSGLVCN
jgi:predicted outer membrane repeat protein